MGESLAMNRLINMFFLRLQIGKLKLVTEYEFVKDNLLFIKLLYHAQS
jgi:hypothetical protein